MTRKITLAVMGDSKVGKSTMIATYAKFDVKNSMKSTVTHLQRRVLSVVEKQMLIKLTPYEVEIYDSPSSDTPFDCRIRNEIFGININLFIICFAINSRTSFENATTRWMEKIMDRSRNTPVLLIGTKSDLREDQTIEENCLVNKKEAKLIAKDCGAVMYLECSSKSMKGLRKVFKTAVKIAASIMENKLISDNIICCNIQ